MIPSLSLRGGAIMGGGRARCFSLPFLRRRDRRAVTAESRLGCWQMFFLGAGFMLVETKAVVHMALLFGGTWIVNSVVFFAVLVMILAANLFVSSRGRGALAPYYVGLSSSLVVNVVVPLDAFLGMVARTAGRRRVPAGVHADPLRGRDLRGVVQPRPRTRPRVRRQHRRRDARRAGRIQLDAARLSVRRAGRGRVLCLVSARRIAGGAEDRLAWRDTAA